MCRNIKNLFNFDPPATDAEILASSLQFVRKIKGFSGIGHSVEDCLFKARWGMKEHVALLKEKNLSVPKRNSDPKIIIQNERKMVAA